MIQKGDRLLVKRNGQVVLTPGREYEVLSTGSYLTKEEIIIILRVKEIV